MHIDTLFRKLRELETDYAEPGLSLTCRAYVNHYGDEFLIEVIASEPYSTKGYWSSTKKFRGDPNSAPALYIEALHWVRALPSKSERALDQALKHIAKMIEDLPEGSDDITQKLWDELGILLTEKSKALAENVLPRGEADWPSKRTPASDLDDEIPF